MFLMVLGSHSSGDHGPGDHGSGGQEFLQCQLAGHLLFFCHQLTGNITEAASLGVLTTGTYTCHRFEFKNNSSHAFLGKLKLVAGPACHVGPLQPYQLRTHRYPSFIIIIIIVIITTSSPSP